MREFGSFEAKNKLAELLDAVEQGEEIMITRRGKPIAKPVRPDARGDATKVAGAAKRVMRIREGITLGQA
jgi:antitoxin (DNA-binding transcriptional repressor) of toxin-antitoxin stability system